MIRLVVALSAEARPLIRRFGLARAEAGDFPVWRADGVALVVSGVGRRAASAATVDLASREPAGEAAWLNVGIAGHRSLPLGGVVLAHKVTSAADEAAWYPPLVFEPPCATATVTTVDRPETAYPGGTVYEMEAAGFYAAAARFASAELIQVVKVISDNAEAPVERLTASRVRELIAGRLDVIERIASETAALARELDARRAPPPALAKIAGRWRFTVTQRRRLERVLRRLAVVDPAAPAAAELAGLRSARAVLAALEERLAAQPPGLG